MRYISGHMILLRKCLIILESVPDLQLLRFVICIKQDDKNAKSALFNNYKIYKKIWLIILCYFTLCNQNYIDGCCWFRNCGIPFRHRTQAVNDDVRRGRKNVQVKTINLNKLAKAGQ